ncbi:hypothetical protein BV22DRAFT_1200086 [Leucogyrophana mollusca]|uniref:Uncharacterized protein n=1 Tax=Leucogyrophana mollusca TaxID=85980 RepID=A0ACB8AX69_9AGAM|nr:hypothetical protein BV22DRAFT_1200086 [Leucogyrophana mollusca]
MNQPQRRPLTCAPSTSWAGRKGLALSDSTNVPRRLDSNCHSTKHHNPLLSLSRPRKAPPTVSLSSANATCPPPAQPLLPSPSDLPDVQTHSQSDIPFPSCSLDFPMTSDIDMRDGTSDNICLLSLSCDIPTSSCDNLAPWSAQIRLRKRRSLACTSQPKGLRRSKSKSKESGGDIVSRKRQRKSRRQVADLQFQATVHRSLIACIRTAEDSEQSTSRPDMEGDGITWASETMQAQDMLLASRLWQRLLDQGCTPVSLDDVPVSSSDLRPTASSDSLDLAEMPVDHAETPQPSLGPTHPPAISETTPSTPSASLILHHPRILSIPQLVATLFLQHNDRCSIRARPGWRPRRHVDDAQPSPCASRCCSNSSPSPTFAHDNRARKKSPLSTLTYPVIGS